MKDTAPHPAKWTQSILDEIEDLLFEHEVPDDALVFDPFAGPDLGRLAAAVEPRPVAGTEIEWPWVSGADGSMQGDALRPPLRPASVGVLVTSPAYGNRMADNHDPKDACKPCGGSGEAPPLARSGPIPCRACGGSGLSKRNTYKHVLGRDPSPGASTVLQWGKAYRDFHEAAWTVANDALAPGALVVVNVKNHVRDHRERAVVEWHLNAWLRLGARLEEVRRVAVRGNRNGENGDARVPFERILVLRAKSVAW